MVGADGQGLVVLGQGGGVVLRGEEGVCLGFLVVGFLAEGLGVSALAAWGTGQVRRRGFGGSVGSSITYRFLFGREGDGLRLVLRRPRVVIHRGRAGRGALLGSFGRHGGGSKDGVRRG